MCMAMSAQGLKTYSGPYRANAHFLLGTQKATYTYKNAEDGTRIYEGNFTYSCITNQGVQFCVPVFSIKNNVITI